MVPHTEATVQVDCATSWAALAKDRDKENSQLRRLKISIDLGRHFNQNKNPVIDNACKEFHKEALRLKPDGGILSEIERATITMNMNQRIRKSGFSSKEICFKRDIIRNTEKAINDETLSKDIIQDRKQRHNIIDPKPNQSIKVGHNVFVKDGKSKLKARELFRVVETFTRDDEPWAIIQKHNTQFRAKRYEVKTSELILLPGQTQEDLNEETHEQEETASDSNTTTKTNSRPRRKAAQRALDLITRTHAVKQHKPRKMLHGWDYERMMELWTWDGDNADYLYYPQDNDFEDNDEHLSTSTNSSTTDISEDSIPIPNVESNQDDEEDLFIDTYSNPPHLNGEISLPETTMETTRTLQRRRLEPYSEHSDNDRNTMTSPINLNQCQNLDEYLNLPNVVDAAALGTSENTRMIPRTSQRPKTGPEDYATFHRTGTKQLSSQRMDTRREESRKDAAHRTKP